MNPSIALVERIRKTTEKRTNYAVAKALRISQSNLKQVLDGKRNLGPEALARAADILRVPLDETLSPVMAATASTPEQKAFWERRIPRVLPALLIVGLGAGLLDVSEPAAFGLTSAEQSIHYAQM